jgi:hypothetical protein
MMQNMHLPEAQQNLAAEFFGAESHITMGDVGDRNTRCRGSVNGFSAIGRRRKHLVWTSASGGAAVFPSLCEITAQLTVWNVAHSCQLCLVGRRSPLTLIA